MQWPFSRRANALTSSAIREILKVTEQPDMISFAGGLPSAATFPVEAMQEATQKVLAEQAESALQYGPSEGFGKLREWIATTYSRDGAEVRPSQVLLTTGSQQALDLIAKALIDPGSRILVETPTYLGALQAFSLFEPEYVSVASDEQGLLPEALTAEVIEGARFLYALPNFQNPTGRRLPLARREALAAIAREHGLPIVEDDPYGDLDYRGERLRSLRSLAPRQVVHLGSFSKVLSPGLRLGYVIADEAFIAKLVQLKQAADLHTSSLAQHVAYDIVCNGFLDEHIPRIRRLYGERCQAMLDALERHMPAGVSWNCPEGGMFIWVTLPEQMDSTELLADAIGQRVAFVPGAPFYATLPEHNTLRLSFVTVEPARIDEGIRRLAELISVQLGVKPASLPLT